MRSSASMTHRFTSSMGRTWVDWRIFASTSGSALKTIGNEVAHAVEVETTSVGDRRRGDPHSPLDWRCPETSNGPPRVSRGDPHGAPRRDAPLPTNPVRPGGRVAPRQRGIRGVLAPVPATAARVWRGLGPLDRRLRPRCPRPSVFSPPPAPAPDVNRGEMLRGHGPGRNRTDDLDFVRVPP